MIDDTIAAIGTAPGEAGIGIVRMSGSESEHILSKLFKPKKDIKVKNMPSRQVVYGVAFDMENNPIDEVLVIIMRAPYSYTTEDVCEIHCHGGFISVRKILDIVLQNGARMAEAGEFTKRAFLNGRIDLAQAEAVIDIITAKTDKGLSTAFNQLEGELSKEIRRNSNKLLSIVSHIEASIDFPEHDIEEITLNNIKVLMDEVHFNIKALIDSFYQGKIVRDGLNTTIIGRPNVGKSSLLNLLLRENRAIVTDVPGTTRDLIEEYLNISGVLVKLIDTAGIRETEDVVEKIGVQRTKEAIEKSDLVVLVVDISSKLIDQDMEIIELIKNRRTIVVANKMDMGIDEDLSYLKQKFGEENVILMSVVNRIGLDHLEKSIKEILYSGEVIPSSKNLVTNARHKNLLDKAFESVGSCIDSINEEMPIDMLSIDIKDAWNYLGQITGDSVEEDIVNEIFKNFCVGK